MRKTLLTLTPAALLMLVVAGSSQAATNAVITITGNVVAATCDVSASTNNLDLGNHAKTEFISVAKPVANNQQKFTVGLNNCMPPVAGGDIASLVVNGQTLGGNPSLFNSSGTNAGVMLSLATAPTTYITAGQKLPVATAATTGQAAADYNGKSLTFIAGLASSSASTGVDIGSVNAPITFQFAYN